MACAGSLAIYYSFCNTTVIWPFPHMPKELSSRARLGGGSGISHAGAHHRRICGASSSSTSPCTRFQELARAFKGHDACLRFDGHEHCCLSHRIEDQPCQYIASNASCRRTFEPELGCCWPAHALVAAKGGDAGVAARPQAAPLLLNLTGCPVRKPLEDEQALKYEERKGATMYARAVPKMLERFVDWEQDVCSGGEEAELALSDFRERAKLMCLTPNKSYAPYAHLKETTRSARSGRRCLVGYLPYCGERCEIPSCLKRQTGPMNCRQRSSIDRLVKMRCTAPPLSALALARRVLERRPMFIARAGNGEFKWVVGIASFFHEVGRNLTELYHYQSDAHGDGTRWKGAPGRGREWQRTQRYSLFGVPPSNQKMYDVFRSYAATREQELPRALHRFIDEYPRALASADTELLWGDQCQGMLVKRCQASQLGPKLAGNTAAAAAAPNLQASLTALSSIRRLLTYNTSLDFWLDVLEELSRSKARLLIVTGFAASVRHQIPRLHLIHPKRDLSGLRFRVLGAPMGFPRLGTPDWPLPADIRDENYDTRLDRMMASPEFDARRNDVAFLGCGPLGLPLARHAKLRGMSAVYVGGLIQLFFGCVACPAHDDRPVAVHKSTARWLSVGSSTSQARCRAHSLSPCNSLATPAALDRLRRSGVHPHPSPFSSPSFVAASQGAVTSRSWEAVARKREAWLVRSSMATSMHIGWHHSTPRRLPITRNRRAAHTGGDRFR